MAATTISRPVIGNAHAARARLRLNMADAIGVTWGQCRSNRRTHRKIARIGQVGLDGRGDSWRPLKDPKKVSTDLRPS